MKKYFAALDKNNEIIAIGLVSGRFDRRCFPFSNQCFARWINSGAKYCQLNIESLAELINTRSIVNQHLKIESLPHGRIRTSQAGLTFKGLI